MKKKTTNISPEIEQEFLKRYAILSFAFGMLLISGIASYYLKYIELKNVALILTSITILAMFIAFARVLMLLPKAKCLFWNGNFQDEYLNFLSLKAHKYSAITVFVIAGLLILLPTSVDLSGAGLGISILSLMCLAYAIPLLIWLRGDNE